MEMLRQNRPAIWGFVLSLIQLVLHSLTLGLVAWLAESGRAETLDRDSAWSWVVVILLLLAMTTTLAAMFVCLFMGLRRRPRVLALFGLAITFFSGTTITVMVIMMALRSMAAGA